MVDGGEASWWGRFGQGYGPLVAVVAAVVAAALVIPALNVIDAAPAHVTEADIARLQSEAPLWRSAEPDYATYRGRTRVMPSCQRDQMVLNAARFLGLPKSQLLRIEYTQLTDCRRQS